MKLLEHIKSAQYQSRVSRDVIKSKLLTTLIGELESENKRTGKEITDDQVIAKVRKFLKNIEETIKLVPNNTALENEAYILKEFLPKQMNEAEIMEATESCDNFPEAMKWLKTHYSGRYDPRLAAQVLKSYF